MGILDTLLAFLRIGSEAAPLVAEIVHELEPAAAPTPEPAVPVTSGSDYLRGLTDEQRTQQLSSATEAMTGDAREKLGEHPAPPPTKEPS